MAALTQNSKIEVLAFKNRLKEVINDLLPADSSCWTNGNVPDSQMNFMLSNKADLYGTICIAIDNDNRITTNSIITATPVFEVIRDIFVYLGRCRKVYYQNAQNYPGQGTQVGPQQIANDVGATSGGGTFAYFKHSFALSGNYASPAAGSWGTTKNVTGFKTFPEWGTNNWNDNTTRATNTQQVASMSVNNIIKALENVEQQMTDFKNEWSNKSSLSGWWSGAYNDTSNTSNRLFFVRYWCHNNCHGNCHTDRARR